MTISDAIRDIREDIMTKTTRRAALAALTAATAFAAFGPSPAQAEEAFVYSDIWGHAIRGYDPVAYFREGEAVEGSSDYEAEWNDSTWRFASAENRGAFLADPEAYAPQYGGYCAWAVSQGSTASVDPEQWRIVDGRLYLNYNADVQATWLQDVPGFIEKADSNWPTVLSR